MTNLILSVILIFERGDSIEYLDVQYALPNEPGDFKTVEIL